MPASFDNILPAKIANPIAAAALLYGILSALQYMLKSTSGPTVTESPLKSLLPLLSEEEISQLPYPREALPGARDVASPYGSIRVYEWGPESGRKVLFVHGISTPSIALGGIAHQLVDHGCRVMLFDLFGRGFSDNPDDLPQDTRLFCSQILIVLSSSTLSWTGRNSGRFALIGYSLGGGIATSFTADFRDLVSSLVLLAPSGIIRPNQVSLRTNILYSHGLLPEFLLVYLVRRRLAPSVEPPSSAQNRHVESISFEANPSVPIDLPYYEADSTSALQQKQQELTPASAVPFQVKHHRAFLPAFMSSMRHGPIMAEHGTWNRVGQWLTLQKRDEKNDRFTPGLDHCKVLIICGNEDTTIVAGELEPDATSAFEGNVEFRHIPGGHDVPISKSDEVAAAILQFWTSSFGARSWD